MDSLKNETLQNVIQRLDKVYYSNIEGICIATKRYIHQLQKDDHLKSQYINLCSEIIENIQNYISAKREMQLPYINSLFEKEVKSHDCRKCKDSGSCNLKHYNKVSEIKQSYILLRDILSKLQMVVLPLYSDDRAPQKFGKLRDEISVLENSLSNLLYVEETYLLPRVLEAQKAIHARD